MVGAGVKAGARARVRVRVRVRSRCSVYDLCVCACDRHCMESLRPIATARSPVAMATEVPRHTRQRRY